LSFREADVCFRDIFDAIGMTTKLNYQALRRKAGFGTSDQAEVGFK
jgi:hypothetical protein